MRTLVLYPVGKHGPSLSQHALETKIARHSPCDLCECRGLHPGTTPITRDDAGMDNAVLSKALKDERQYHYLAMCGCGHDAKLHGNSDELPNVEVMRRAKVAIRIDELLEDKGLLLDFSYTDDDIESLRKQMRPLREARDESPLSEAPLSPLVPEISYSSPISGTSRKRSASTSSSLSEVPLRPQKKTRLSSTSDLSEEDEDKPLAERVQPTRNGSNHGNGLTIRGPRAGKTAPASMTLSQKASQRDTLLLGSKQVNGANGAHAGKFKPDDPRLDHAKLARIATGVTVDAGAPSAHPTARPEKAAVLEERSGILKIVAVENDGQPRSLVILTGLKTLFQKQLPKMPREYIARLVYDENSRALAIIKRGYKVVGGITFRPFPHRDFAEIVFFATASVDQVKGYGGMLMNHFKTHIQKTYRNMDHFLTYADNYAVGYFKKQGFSKEITLNRSIWAGYIKDYEGGTLMQCTMVPKIDYLNVKAILTEQREEIMEKIRAMSRSHITYDGLAHFANVEAGQVAPPLDPSQVPGLRETGWTADLAQLTEIRTARSPERARMQKILHELQNHQHAWAFLRPVDTNEVADYRDVIKNPMDLGTMEHKLDHNAYASMDDFISDANLIFSNCLLYNPSHTSYAKHAIKVREFLKELLERIQE